MKKLSKSAIREIIEAYGFEAFYDFISKTDPERLRLPVSLPQAETQSLLFEDEYLTKPIDDLIAELDEFFEITSKDLEPLLMDEIQSAIEQSPLEYVQNGEKRINLTAYATAA
jgi:hypothetical protein